MRATPAWLAALILGACASHSAGPGASPAPRRLNVVFLLSDDQRADAIGAYGHPDVKTPNLDRLVAEGFSFDQAYCMGSRQGAVCGPSRAMMFTGKELYHIAHPFDLPDEMLLLPELLRKDGYDTFATGKWHCGKRSFSRAFAGGGEIFFGGMGSHTELPVNDFDAAGTYPAEGRHPVTRFSSTAFVDAAIDFLRHRGDERPFFLHVAFTAPHDPRTPPAEFRALYDPAKLALPANFLPEHPFDNGELSVRDERLAPWPRTPGIVREHLADYYGMISHMDREIGRLLDALEETGHADDTLVVFASDHGLAIGSHGLMGKQSVYEHSMRSPLILRGPGLPAGGHSDAFVYLYDIFPTVCELAGERAPEDLDGRSLVPLVHGTPDGWREEIFLTYGRVQRALRTERWKLIRYPAIGRMQLFDLAADPAETRDLIDDPANIAVVADLRERLVRARLAAGDELAP